MPKQCYNYNYGKYKRLTQSQMWINNCIWNLKYNYIKNVFEFGLYLSKMLMHEYAMNWYYTNEFI